jgi:serine/threonine-protein kinase
VGRVGAVVAQSPNAQTSAAPGSAVNLTIGKALDPQPIPSVIGLTLAEARTKLADAGYTVGVVDYDYGSLPGKDGTIVKQTPSATNNKAVDLILKTLLI